LVRLDRAFCNTNWDLDFDNHGLHAFQPLSVVAFQPKSGPRRPATFRFENFWTKMPGFKETVTAAWQDPNPHSQPVHIVNHKLRLMAKKLKTWSKGLLSNHKQQLIMGLDVILQLDVVQESRNLTPEEKTLCAASWG
jgi:hypothetical protein